jgi:hypothetical protein
MQTLSVRYSQQNGCLVRIADNWAIKVCIQRNESLLLFVSGYVQRIQVALLQIKPADRLHKGLKFTRNRDG